MKLHISLKEAALKSKVSPSLIYHYIQKGLLPSPSHVPNKGGGALAVYPKSIVQNILRIKKALKKKRSLDQVREGLSVEKKKIVAEEIGKLYAYVSKENYDEEALRERLQS